MLRRINSAACSGDMTCMMNCSVSCSTGGCGSPCGPGAYPFGPGPHGEPCGMFHFWSPHSGGAQFAFADAVMPALASRTGGEAVEMP